MRWNGFALSLIAAVLWGVLPIFLQICLQVLDSSSITWVRFSVAGIFVFLVLSHQKALPPVTRLGKQPIFLLLVTSICLIANYVANVESLDYVSPETVQVVMQLAPFLLMLGGVIFFKEQFGKMELTGAVILFCGLMLFFHHRLDLLFGAVNQFNIGVLLVVFAAATWAVYALLQKVLLKSLTAKQLTMMLYLAGMIILYPFTDLTNLTNLSGLQIFALVFCCFNTIVGYGAFTEAMMVWSASKVSAVVATAPIFTFLSVFIAEKLLPESFAAIDLGVLSYVGAIGVVIGSMTIALAKDKARV